MLPPVRGDRGEPLMVLESPAELLTAITRGDRSAAERLTPLVYAELRGLAGRIAGSSSAPTLQPTALVHEAWLKMVADASRDFRSETHFKAVAAAAMRQVLIDALRRRGSGKRGGDWRRVTLSALPGDGHAELDLADVEAALAKLATVDPRAARGVELRFFGGLTEAAVAELLGVTDRTVRNDWVMARAWLRRELNG